METGEIREVDDIGWALSGRNTIDLYTPSKSAMNSWGVRTVNIEILHWGDDADSLALLHKRRKYRHVQRMVDGLETRIRRGETNPEPMVAVATPAVPAAVPTVVAVSATRSETTARPPETSPSGTPLRPFRPIQ